MPSLGGGTDAPSGRPDAPKARALPECRRLCGGEHPRRRARSAAAREDGRMGSFYFNVSTGQVEELANKSQSKTLLGPYSTRAEAERALATAHERTEEWDEE